MKVNFLGQSLPRCLGKRMFLAFLEGVLSVTIELSRVKQNMDRPALVS